MKLAWCVALVLMLIGFAILFRPPRIDETMAPVTRSGDAAPPSSSVIRTSSVIGNSADSNSETSIDDPAASGARASIASETPAVVALRSRVSGRCVDENGAALSGVEITLQTLGERWSKSESAPFTLVDGRPVPRFRAVSAGDGRFVLDVPRPDARSVELVMTPDEGHLVVQRTLEKVLDAGDVDLGDVRSESAGRIHGRVRTPSGEPVAGVMVSAILPPQFVNSVSDEDGRFAIGRLRAGSWRLQPSSEEHNFATQLPILVRPGRGPVEVEIVAEPAPMVSGRVVDAQGAPIGGATVAAYRGPSNVHDIESVFSLVDGSFELYLRKASSRGKLRLNVQHDGFALDDPFGPVDENARDLVIVMKSAPKMTFRVVDGVRGTPVTRYRIRIAPRLSFRPEIGWWIEAEDHPGGEAVLDVPGEDNVVLLAAEGRARLQETVAPDEPGGKVQTLRMFAGGTIVGRATRAGAPAVGVAMQVAESSTIPLVTETREERLARLRRGELKPYRGSSPDWAERGRSVDTDGDGRFRFEELGEGSWTVTVRGIGIAARSLDPVVLGRGATVDVGDVAIDSGGSIEGRVLVPDDVDAHFERITLDGNALFVNADERGKYRFEGLEPGKHVVEVQFSKLLGLSGLLVEVDLADSERRVLDLDLRESKLARVHVRVTRDGRPFSNAPLEVDGPLHWGTQQDRALTDALGEADLLVPPRVPFHVVARNADQRLVARSAAVILESGQHADVDVDVHPGRLEIDLPDRIVRRGKFSLTLQEGAHVQTFNVRVGAGYDWRSLEWSSNHIDVGEIPPGEYTVVAHQRDDASATDVFRFEGSARVDAGATSVVDFKSE